MNDATPEPRRCEVCGDPIHRDNKLGVCDSPDKPDCRKIRWRKKREAIPKSERQPCDVCGKPLNRNNESGICGSHDSPACMRERKRRAAQRAGTIVHRIIVSAGDTFGWWTALEDYSPASKMVLVRCQCGTQKRVEGKYLTRGISTSCGCGRRHPRRNKPPYLTAGTSFGRLTLLEDVATCNDRTRFSCECGGEITTRAILVKTGGTRSCGCIRRENRMTHGFSNHPLYSTWNGILDRCSDPTHPSWHNYGGREDHKVTVCDRWRDPWLFAEDILREIGARPAGKNNKGRALYELDRKDNDGGYWCGRCTECISAGRPFNVQWSTKSQQVINQRKVFKMTKDMAALTARVAELEALLAGCTCGMLALS